MYLHERIRIIMRQNQLTCYSTKCPFETENVGAVDGYASRTQSVYCAAVKYDMVMCAIAGNVIYIFIRMGVCPESEQRR